jgi:hypothetical protein
MSITHKLGTRYSTFSQLLHNNDVDDTYCPIPVAHQAVNNHSTQQETKVIHEIIIISSRKVVYISVLA